MNAAATWVFQDPLQNPENLTFWQEAQQGRLMLKHCSACDRFHHYPRPYCPHCGSDQTTWRPSAGLGQVYSFTRMLRGVEIPYLMAYVQLDEGVTMMTHLQASDWDAVHIGMRVRLDFSASASGQNVAVFVPHGQFKASA